MRNLLQFLVFFFISVLCLQSCNKDDDKKSDGTYDPSKPVVFTDYSPKEGKVRTRLFIHGNNFGNDVSKIKVTIGGRDVKVIGSSGDVVYCMLPKGSGSGQVKVILYDDEGKVAKEHAFNEEFTYVAGITVGTLVGKVDEYGNSAVVNGTFEEAGFNYPSWALYEPQTNSIFISEADRLIRKVDIDGRLVTTLITNGQASFRKMQTAALSFDTDTLFFIDDHGQNNNNFVAIAYSLRTENYRRPHAYLKGRTGYALAQHPIDKHMYHSTWWGASIMRTYYDPNVDLNLNSREIFKVGGNSNFLTTIFFHPTGNYAYILKNTGIYKSMYNWQTKELEPPLLFAGHASSGGDVDAIGTSARFSWLYQGVFVKNENYAGQEDEYDFYLCDINNHSVRYVAPTGEVNTYAGKGSPAANGNKHGYIDGDPRLEARFNQPSGIAYDEARKIFYITERINRRVRTITVE